MGDNLVFHSNRQSQQGEGQSQQGEGKANLSRRKFFTATASLAPLALVSSSGADPLPPQASQATPLGTVGQPQLDGRSSIRELMRKHAAQLSIFDTHEHIWHQERRIQENPDFFVLFSHYTRNDLVSAGMPPTLVGSGSGPSNLGLQDHTKPLELRWQDFAPYWPYTRTTGYGRCMLLAARDLFGVEDINERTYRTLSERISAANQDRRWYQTVLKEKGRIYVSLLDDLTTDKGEPLNFDPNFFWIITRMDYLVMASPDSVAHIEEAVGVSIHTLTDLERALGQAVENAMTQASQISPHGLAGIKCGIAYQRTLAFEKVPRVDAERAFEGIFASSKPGSVVPATQKRLQDYMMYKLVEQCAEHHLPMQIHTGLQSSNQDHIAWTNPSHLSDLLGEYQQVRFDLFHGGYPYCGELVALAKNLPNVFPDLCWLHIIAPGVAKRALHDLIETVPANKILGFGGDFFHVEGAYAHAQMARAITAEVLAEKVEEGYLKEDEAAYLLERILYRNGNELFTKPSDRT